MILMNTLERLFFIDEENNNDFTNEIIGKNFYTFERSVITNEANTGLVIAIAPKTHYKEIAYIKHLEVVEKELKAYPSQFIKVFTSADILYVYMNKQPTWDQIIKIKILQWTLFNNHIKSEENSIMDFLNAMLNKDLKGINNALTNIMNRPDFIDVKYNELINVFKYGSTKNIRMIQSDIRSLHNKITDYENYINSCITEIKNKNLILAAYTNNSDEDLKPIIRYLLKHPYIKSTNIITESLLEFYYEAPIIYFDKYILEKIILNKTGIEKKILYIFYDNKYELITKCVIQFNTDDFKVTFKKIGDGDIIGHPHIDKFNCFGNHNKAVRESAAERDYLGAIEQISQAVLNLNFSDTYVIDTMLATLKHNPNYITWKNKKTGDMLTTKEVLKQYEETEIVL